MTPEQFVTRLRVHFGAQVHWVDAMGDTRKVVIGKRFIFVGRYGTLKPMGRDKMVRSLDDLGVSWSAFEAAGREG
ncbi:MAG: hypothetical protein WCJ64_17335 [Rhodospirillaceae bacterium]